MSLRQQRWVAGALTLLAFLAPVKFGNPSLSHLFVSLPATGWEWLVFSWPAPILWLLAFAGLGWTGRDRQTTLTGGALALVFLLSQMVGLPASICWQTSADTVLHFAVCVLVLLAAQRVGREEWAVRWILGGLAVGTAVVVAVTLQQHFGGLAATRQMVLEQYGGGTVPEGVMRKLEGGRVFGTLVNPNMLAGFLVVAFAPVLALVWRLWRQRVPVVAVGAVLLWCLWVTGSRGGWLSWGVMAGVWVLLRVREGRQRALALAGVGVGAVLAVGLLARGWSSMEARVDCWRAAVAIIGEHPWLGTGPGTFGSVYPLHKLLSVAEEAQLAHNSLLQVWSDTGVVALVVFVALWGVGLAQGVRLARREPENAIWAALVAGVSGWLAHGMLDFGLHVPGVTLPAFLFLGLMTANGTGAMACAAERPRRTQRMVALLMVALALFWAGRMLVANARATAGDWVGAVRLAPRNAQYWSDLGRASLRSGDADTAVVAFRQAARWDRYRAVYQWELAQALMVRDKGVTAEMVQALREAVRLYPGKAAYQESLAGAEKILRQSGGESGRVPPDQSGVTSQQTSTGTTAPSQK